ncbi:MAG: RsmB/NOP family class I SAM-dependent RNA methyltransferase [Neisseria sp.]|nr:RsmB/NOP family class I SAM-dependent RNA methyltransferase [Neisseria sp.]
MFSFPLTHTITASREILAFTRPADAVLAAFFRQHNKLGRQERAAVADTVFTLLRHYEKINTVLHDKAATRVREAVLCALALRGDAACASLHETLSAPEKALLTQLQTQDFSGSLNVVAELPAWLIDTLRGQYDDAHIAALGQALAQSAPLDVRVNTLKARRDKVLAQLQAEGFQATATPYAPFGIRFADKPALQRHALYLDGTLEIQDEGSQLLALLSGAKRGEMVVDFCAGAGGKTLAMGAMMQNAGRLYAFDVSEQRLAKLKPRLEKSGLSNVTTQLLAHENDARLHRLRGKCDAVIVDAPCSGLGTLRRSPDLKYRQSPESVNQLIELQKNILRSAAELVAPQGRLLYATCSLLAAENTVQIEHFLAENPAFELLDAQSLLRPYTDVPINGKMMQLSPLDHQTDGFFAAVLRKC